jgi:Ca2+-binding RTX toxin-like protein
MLFTGVYRPTNTGPQANQVSVFAARFLSSGLPDYSYDDDGIYLAGSNLVGQFQAATLVLPDGSVVLAGSQPDGQPVGFVISKLQGGEGTPSPTPTITLNSKGTLIVTTTDAKDMVSLSIRQSDGRLILRSGTFAQSFAVSKVKRIAIYTLGGDDIVTIGAGVRGSYVEAGDGADTVNGGQFGDVLLGGLGADQLFGNDGDDTLLGEGGDDYLLGGAGKDDLFGNGGTDILSGAGGNDRLFGGPNDADRILGGAGTDSAAQDDQDSYESIELLLAS